MLRFQKYKSKLNQKQKNGINSDKKGNKKIKTEKIENP